MGADQKHDEGCLERRQWGVHMRFVCSCEMTDQQVRDGWRALQRHVATEGLPAAGDVSLREVTQPRGSDGP